MDTSHSKLTPRNSSLTPEQKKYNKHLSQMRVVVENTIARVKQWKIMKGVFRHFRNGKGKLDINHILTIVMALTNLQIKIHPIRSSQWVFPEWLEIFETLEEN